ERLRPIGRFGDRVAEGLEDLPDHQAIGFLIVHHQDTRSLHHPASCLCAARGALGRPMSPSPRWGPRAMSVGALKAKIGPCGPLSSGVASSPSGVASSPT